MAGRIWQSSTVAVDASGNATVAGTMILKEQADAEADTAAYGQLWVNTATPNELYFTTDAGDDIQLTTGTGTAGGGGAAANSADTILHLQVFA